MPHYILILFMLFLRCLAHAQIVQLTVPNGLKNVDGNSSTRYPFHNDQYDPTYVPIRYQQVYDASQFSQVRTGGAYITFIFFRADCSSGRATYVRNMQVRLSTTPKTPATLSLTFSNNVGADEAIVFGPTNYGAPDKVGCPYTAPFEQSVAVSPAFFYNPAKGNLLLEIRHTGMDQDSFPLEYRLDAHTASSNIVARVFATGSNIASSGVNDGLGIVTEFQFETPKMSIWLETNTLHVALLTWITGVRIQTSTAIGPSAQWLDYNGPYYYNDYGGIIITNSVTSLQSTLYYRAILERASPP